MALKLDIALNLIWKFVSQIKIMKKTVWKRLKIEPIPGRYLIDQLYVQDVSVLEKEG